VRCRRNKTPCNYDADVDTTRYFTLKKRHDEMQKEHEQLLCLFDFLRTRSEDEALEIVKRIRESEESFTQIYETITQADLLLQSTASHSREDGATSRVDSGAGRPSTREASSREGGGSSRDEPQRKSWGTGD
jgi:hypothetical protein